MALYILAVFSKEEAMKDVTMKEARELIVQAEKEIDRLKDIQNDLQALQKECALRETVGNLKSDLCHDYDPILGGNLHSIPDEWVLTENAARSYKSLQRTLNPPLIK